MESEAESEEMEMFWFFWLWFRRAYDSAYDSDFLFSLGHKRSYQLRLRLRLQLHH